jgi:hypothetical protein
VPLRERHAPLRAPIVLLLVCTVARIVLLLVLAMRRRARISSGRVSIA